ncbi:MAG TPA: serine hydrolase domain-containing protein, partial [Armatimonadota bacterium]|nr:serine hydrolase domain-containing protein [Armatimonadota bacterium]
MNSSSGAECLHRLVEQGVAEGLYLGAAYRVLQAGSVLAAGAAGLAQEAPAVPARNDTLWDLASLTKPVATATSVLILAQEGAFHLGEEVASLLPAPAPSLAGITLRHCLTHTSGLRPWEKLHSQGWSRAEVVRRVFSAERERPPGTGYAYSDLGYLLLGEVVHAVSGRSIAEFAGERVFEPLGMRTAGYLPPAEWRQRLAAT